VRKKCTQKVVRLAIFCIKIFATLCPQNAWQIKIKELLSLCGNFYSVICWERFHEKKIYSKVYSVPEIGQK